MAAINTDEVRAAGHPPADGGKPSRLWWWIGVMLAIQVTAWTAWFVIASHHPVEEIPLVQGP